MPLRKKKEAKKPRGAHGHKHPDIRAKQYTIEDMIQAAKKCRGIVTEMAEELGCSSVLINVRRKEHPELEFAIKEERRKLRGKVTRNIAEAIYDESNPEQKLEISKWASRCKFMEGSGFEQIEKRVLSNDPKNPLPNQNTQVNVITIDHLPLEIRQQLLEHVKKVEAINPPNNEE